MTPLLITALGLAMVATSFLSGLFGMAGGMILIGILLAVMPVPAAMVLHAVTQMASNGWRGLLWRRHARWSAVGAYVAGCALALGLWSLVLYVPSKPLAFILLGLTPFLARIVPVRLRPDPESPLQGTIYGTVCMSSMLLTGVSGPLLDTYFLGGRLDRREIVATKAVCQVAGHAMKLAYFGSIVDQAAMLDPWLGVIAIVASVAGTTLARRYLEAMTDQQYRLWAGRVITAIALFYVGQGGWLLATAPA
ncbi:TSUP family transporter [Desertibaculum subflavum]|uniref:TSUP family transporter n=1 Tax=Desertibaculum subflavum TaxID=2268458 RepID=UPI000E66E238